MGRDSRRDDREGFSEFSQGPGSSSDPLDAARARRLLADDPLAASAIGRALAREGPFMPRTPLDDRSVLLTFARRALGGQSILASGPEERGRSRLPQPLQRPREDEPFPEPLATRGWVHFRVLASGDVAVPGVKLQIQLPGRSLREFTTDAAGMIEIDGIQSGQCAVVCPLEGADRDSTWAVVQGDADEDTPALQPVARAAAEDADRPFVAHIRHHKVVTGESLKHIAERSGLTWQHLALFNWGTDDPDQINAHLRDDVGCTAKTPDGFNYSFRTSDKPGLLFVPRVFEQTGLATEKVHEIRVRPEDDFLIVVENERGLRIPEVEYEATLADGSVHKGQVGKGGVDRIQHPPRGEIRIAFPDPHDVEAKSLASIARRAFDDREHEEILEVLKFPGETLKRVVGAYDAHFDDYRGNGLLHDIDADLTEQGAAAAAGFLLERAELRTSSGAGELE